MKKTINFSTLGKVLLLIIIFLYQITFTRSVFSDEVPLILDPASTSTSTTLTDTVNTDSPVATSSETVSASIATSSPIFELATDANGGTNPLSLDTATTTEAVASTTDNNEASESNIATSTESGAATSTEISTSTESVNNGTPGNITESHPTIVSGTSVATANILNILNSSFINSDGNILFSNFTNVAPTIDLRQGTSTLRALCNLLQCLGEQGVNINMVSNAYIYNSILMSASTGNNAISNTTSGTIETGNAYAGLNLINFSNANFIDSKYLLVTLNAFGGVDGDIVFPSLKDLFQSTTSANSTTPMLDNSTGIADIQNAISANSNTGDNFIGNTSNSNISTGTSTAYTNVFNSVNQKLRENKVMLIFRIVGDWTGSIFNLPDGLAVDKKSEGMFFISGAGSENQYLQLNNSGNSYLEGTSTSNIVNDVALSADTGQNSIDIPNDNNLDTSTALISTGNAYAGANIVNIANQNVISSNWLLAIINIFGNFKGNISFGQPDLWVGSTVTAPTVIDNGSSLSYKVSVINNGDADAHNVKITEIIDNSHQTIENISLPFTKEDDGSLILSLGTIPSGKAVEFTFDSTVKDSTDNIEIKTMSTVSGTETDSNLKDNTDIAIVTTSIPPAPATPTYGGGGIYGQTYYFPSSQTSGTEFGQNKLKQSDIQVTRISSKSIVTLDDPTSVQSLTIWNKSDFPVKKMVFHDRITDWSGNIIHDEEWNLDTVSPHEEILLTYKIAFADNTPPGIYYVASHIETGDLPYFTTATSTIIVFVPTGVPSSISLSAINPVKPLPKLIKNKATSTTQVASSTPVVSYTIPTNPKASDLMANISTAKTGKNNFVFPSIILSGLLIIAFIFSKKSLGFA